MRLFSAVALALLCVSLEARAAEPARLTISTVAGSGSGEFVPFDGSGPELKALAANLNQTFGVEIGPQGALYVTVVGHHRVWRVDLKTGAAKVVAGNGKKGYTGDGGPAVEASLNEPYEVRFDADGNMYFVEMVGAVIRKVDARSGQISTLAGTGKSGFAGDGGPASAAQFKQPHSIALDSKGGMYVADIGNHRIRRIDLAKGTIETLVGTGEAKLPEDGAVCTGQPIKGPRALHIVGETMWIALREGNSVWKLDLETKKLTHIAGTGAKGYSGDGGPAKNATFDGPKGIVAGAKQDVYVVDTENQTIRKIDLATGLISTVAGTGPKGVGFGGDGGPATEAKMARPHGIAIDGTGVLYIGDTNNHRVRRVGPEEKRN